MRRFLFRPPQQNLITATKQEYPHCVTFFQYLRYLKNQKTKTTKKDMQAWHDDTGESCIVAGNLILCFFFVFYHCSLPACQKFWISTDHASWDATNIGRNPTKNKQQHCQHIENKQESPSIKSAKILQKTRIYLFCNLFTKSQFLNKHNGITSKM